MPMTAQHLIWFGSFMIFQGIQTSVAKKPYIFVIFQEGVQTPVPPSGSAHETHQEKNSYHQQKYQQYFLNSYKHAEALKYRIHS